MTKEKIDKEELERYRLTISIVFIGFVLFFGIIVTNIKADTITHKFKNPSFSGINTSSHYLTIENQEFNRKMSIKEEIKAIQEQLERDKENTTLARFIRNLELESFLLEMNCVKLVQKNPNIKFTTQINWL